MNDFQVFYPGAYTKREKPCFEQFIAENAKLQERGPIDVQALIAGTLPKDTPGVGPVLKVNEDMMLYNAKKYDPDNKLYTDDEYAGKYGYESKIAMPMYGAYDDAFMKPIPHGARDIMCVCGLNHNITQLKPVYAGDTLYMVADERTLKDLTPEEGSIYRTCAISTKGTVYNQRGEAVLKVIFRVRENLKSWAEGVEPDPSVRPWESPDWWGRPEHYYTDADWDFIRDIWSKEKVRGDEPLYWEDVKIGDQPIWTLDGPVDASANPTPPFGMGVGGTRTMKKEIMDPEIFKTMVRSEEDGIYRLPNKEDYTPEVPYFEDNRPKMDPPPADPNIKPRRSVFINFMGRDYAVRHINNWMGSHGWIQNLRWGIMSDINDYGYNIPKNPDAEDFISKIPVLKGKKATAHGLAQDIVLVKSYVYDKYVKDGEYFVELGWWVEEITGEIYEEGGATIKLPSRNA